MNGVGEAAQPAAGQQALPAQQGFMLHALQAAQYNGGGPQLTPEMLAAHSLAMAQGLEAAGRQPHSPDPDESHEQERKEKRKVANREAARRMRQRRVDQLSGLGAANEELRAENAALQQQLERLAGHNSELMAEAAGLRQQVLALKQTLESSRTADRALRPAGSRPPNPA